MKTISYRSFSTLLAENAYREDIPSNGSFELTPLCNLDCRMCYVHLQNPSVKDRMLTGEQWISIMKDAVDQGMISAVVTGGEAMTHPDFREIYMYLIDSGVSTRIKTNGILLGRCMEMFREYPPYLIDVSLYGCDSESYLAVTGSDVFEEVTDNIRAAISAGLQLRIMITPSRYMSPWTERVMEFAGTFGVRVMVNSMLIEPNSDTGRKKKDFDLTDAETERIRDRKKKMFPPRLMSEEEEEEIYGAVERRPDVPEKGLYCNGGRTCFAVNWDGTMVPCLNFPREIVCAEPLNDGFKKAWSEVNECVKNYVVPDKCRHCTYSTKCHYCPTMHRTVSARHLCDPDVCDYWMNVYKEDADNSDNTNKEPIND